MNTHRPTRCLPTSSGCLRAARERWGQAIRRRRTIWSNAARADLQQIHAHISLDNPDAADHFIRDLYEAIRSRADLGVSGKSREIFGADVRSFVYRHRIIFFTITDDALFVLRVLHGHRDITPDDFSESND